MTGPALSPAQFRILVVCTGNLCRSPLAERLLADALRPRPDVRVESAGTRARPGLPMDARAERVLQELTGRGHPSFRSRRLSPGLVAESDLVLTAERAHREVVAAMDRGAWGRTFTLVELARLLEPATGGDRGLAATRVAVARAAQQRGLTPPVRPEDDDVQDPIGRSMAVFRRSGESIRSSATAVASGLFALPELVTPGSAQPDVLRHRWRPWR